jgi:hypothetical protein
MQRTGRDLLPSPLEHAISPSFRNRERLGAPRAVFREENFTSEWNPILSERARILWHVGQPARDLGGHQYRQHSYDASHRDSERSHRQHDRVRAAAGGTTAEYSGRTCARRICMLVGCGLLDGTLLGTAFNVHAPLVDTNDDRMQQVMFANGKLWSTLTTVVKTRNGPTRTAAAWFAPTPRWKLHERSRSVVPTRRAIDRRTEAQN